MFIRRLLYFNGTSTNILASGIMGSNLSIQRIFGMFELSKIGLPLLLFHFFNGTFGRKLLPKEASRHNWK